MKKIGKMVLMMMLAIPLLGTNVTAATTENPDGRAVMNPCDDILQPGEYAQFSPRNSGMTSYRVDKVDAAKDLIYNNNLKAWLPAWSLIEVYQSSVGGTGSLDQILRVGEYFHPDGKFAQIHNLGFYVYANNATANTVKLKFKDKWVKDVYVWVNAGPLYEHNPNNKYGSCS